MKLTDESKFLLGVFGVTVAILAIAMIYLSRPPKAVVATREQLIPATAHTVGNPAAKTWLVEFSDFQCPACGAYEPTIEALLAKHPNTLSFTYRHYPLPQHKEGIPSARVSEAAALQGKFWEMHKLLFANQSTLSDALYPDLAKQLNLDLVRFETDRKSSSIAALLDTATSQGDALNINSTPTFFLNGTKLTLTSPDELKATVEKIISSK